MRAHPYQEHEIGDTSHTQRNTFINDHTHASVCAYDVQLLLKPIGTAILILTTPFRLGYWLIHGDSWQVTMPIANDSQCTPCLSTLLNKNICEACIEKEWYLVKRQAYDDCWYSKTQFHEYFGDRCDLRWQQARRRPGGLHPLVRDCEWKKTQSL